MNDQLNDIATSLYWVVPEILLASAFILILLAGLVRAKDSLVAVLTITVFFIVISWLAFNRYETSPALFGMMKRDGLTTHMQILINASAILTCILSFRKTRDNRVEYFGFLVAAVLGGQLLSMSSNFLMIFIALEILSISSYVLAGFSFDKQSAEASVKYFLFGAVASAVMLYGFSLLYGITGSIDFASEPFIQGLLTRQSPLSGLAIVFIAGGLLFKLSSVPMHLWAPDVYEAAPAPIVAFFSTAPKLAALTVLLKFVFAINLYGQSVTDWQFLFTIIIIITLCVGNFAALKQANVKRMMAYSSIAQSGFLMIGIVTFSLQGIHFVIFYSCVYVAMNYLVFTYINFFEKNSLTTIADYSGAGKTMVFCSISMLLGFISLTGLPPMAGFTGKLFLFSAVWSAFEQSGSTILLILLIVGLLNTVVSLFYYLRIPYHAFLKNGKPAISHNILAFENLLAIFLVLVLVILFFQPGLLMSWINKINFAI